MTQLLILLGISYGAFKETLIYFDEYFNIAMFLIVLLRYWENHLIIEVFWYYKKK